METSPEKARRNQIYDSAQMRERLQLDDDLVREVLGVFRDSLPERRAALTRALAEGENEKAAQWAHTLKGTASNLAFTAVAQSAQALESALQTDSTARIALSKAALVVELDCLETLLSEILGGPP